jgi:hypothetical protein
VRVSSQDLLKIARNTGHAFQQVRMESMIRRGWYVAKVRSEGNVHLVFMSMGVAGKYGVIYPNGLMVNMQRGAKSVSYNWKLAREYAQATTPTPGLIAEAA